MIKWALPHLKGMQAVIVKIEDDNIRIIHDKEKKMSKYYGELAVKAKRNKEQIKEVPFSAQKWLKLMTKDCIIFNIIMNEMYIYYIYWYVNKEFNINKWVIMICMYNKFENRQEMYILMNLMKAHMYNSCIKEKYF